MFEGLKRVFSGKDVLARQISLFSVCGIAGLINGHFALSSSGIVNSALSIKIIFSLLLVLFYLFFTGYKVLFLREGELPDIDMRAIKLAFKKIPFIVFLISAGILSLNLYTHLAVLTFLVEVLFVVPIAMMLTGFSYNYENKDAGLLFQKFSAKDYLMLLIKWLIVITACYALTLLIVVAIAVAAGIVYAIMTGIDASEFINLVSMNKLMLAMFANYVTGIVFTYILTIGILTWNYEVLKTAEKK